MQQPLRICHLLSSLKIGGAERFVIDLSLQQQKNGHEVTIISFGASSDELYKVVKQEQINIILLKKRWYSANKHTYNTLKSFDVLHIHSPVTLKALLLTMPFYNKTKMIYTRHGEGKYDSLTWKIVHRCVKPYISALTFVSEKGQQAFNRVHQWRNKKQQVIENGISLPSVASPAVFDKKLKLGSVGRMVDLKKQAHLIEAWALLNENEREGIELHFIGDGECKSQLEQMAKNLSPSKNIKFHGFMNERHTIQQLFDVLVVTSQSEGLSIAILEAMIESKAVIGTDVGGNPKLIHNQETGVLYPYGDIEALKKAIILYFNNNDIAKEHGMNALNHVTQHYSLMNATQQYEALYQFDY